jgi:hypothetical protein
METLGKVFEHIYLRMNAALLNMEISGKFFYHNYLRMKSSLLHMEISGKFIENTSDIYLRMNVVQ